MLSVLIQNVHGMTDTILGNAGLNTKPIPDYHFNRVKDKVIGIKVQYRNNNDVINAIKQYANKIKVKKYYKWDVEYSLYKAKLLIDKENSYDKYPGLYHKILKKELEYYKNQFKINKIDVNRHNIYEFIEKDKDTEKKAMEHFVTCTQDYFIQKGILQSKQPNTVIAEKVSDTSDTKNIMHEELAQTLTTVEGSTTKVPTNVPRQTSRKKRSASEAGLVKMSKFKNSVKAHKKALVTIPEQTNSGKRSASEELVDICSKFKKILLETDKDTNENVHPNSHMLLFHILLILCSMAITVALCVTTAYYITKKKQHNMSYTVTGLIWSMNI